MEFLFKLTSVVNGFTTAIHMDQKPIERDKVKWKGLYLKLEAESPNEAIERLKRGPENNDVWSFEVL